MEEIVNDFLSEVRLIVQEDLAEGEAFASVVLNPSLRWMKFILLDDQPNENKQRITQKEFPNIIQSGVHMPIKMAEGAIADGHDLALPIGVITHLKKVTNRIEGLAALWSRERPEDIELIVTEFNKGNTPQFSYEVPFTEEKEAESGIKDLVGTSLGAATLVNMPAFAGRTHLLAIAAKQRETEETKNMEELETLKQQVTEAQATIAKLTKELAEKNEAQAGIDKELGELREFKTEVDRLAGEADQIAKVEEKFTEAGIEKDDEYFETNKGLLLSLDDKAVDFMVQEFVALAATQEEDVDLDVDLDDKDGVPPVKPKKDGVPKTMKDLAEAMQEELK